MSRPVPTWSSRPTDSMRTRITEAWPSWCRPRFVITSSWATRSSSGTAISGVQPHTSRWTQRCSRPRSTCSMSTIAHRHRPWYDREAFLGLARIRGIECGARYAEAFYVNKIALDLSGVEIGCVFY